MKRDNEDKLTSVQIRIMSPGNDMPFDLLSHGSALEQMKVKHTAGLRPVSCAVEK